MGNRTKLIKGSWHICAAAGDEWLITYAMPPNLRAVKLFAVGHAVELYLKAVNLKMDGKTRLGHEINDLWSDCKNRDPAFMPSYEIRQSVLHAPLFAGKDLSGLLSAPDFEHYYRNSWLYLTAKLLPDLKYGGLEMQRHTGPFGIAYLYPEFHWIEFFRGLRRYLHYPAPNYHDPIAMHLRNGDLPVSASDYLQRLY